MNNERISVDPLTLISGIKKGIIWMILAALVFGAAGFFILKYAVPRKYQSSVMMIVKNETVGNKQLSSDDISAAKKLAKTYSVILKSDIVLNKVIDISGSNVDCEELAKMIDVEPVKDTDVLNITVTSTDSKDSYEICSILSSIAPDAITEAVDYGTCHTVSTVTLNEMPVSPDVPKMTAFSAVMGAFAALGVILYRTMNTHLTVIDDNDVKTHLDLPVLAVIPEIEKG